MSIYFTADAHLGSRYHPDPLAVERRMVRWLEGIRHDAQAIYFLGDTFDYWFEYRHVVPKGYVRFLGKLAELADDGVELHFFTGNHDVWLFDYLPDQFGAVIHRTPLIVDLLGATFFLAHGDEADPSPTFRLLRTLFHSRTCQRLYASIHPRLSMALAHRWSYRSRTSHPNPINDFSPYLNFAHAAVHSHPDIDYLIFGHLHHPLEVPLFPSGNLPRLFILGDWLTVPSCLRWDGCDLSNMQ
ncbi:MAG: UDP-2,3-diacylglucosamine diphosphatase [Tannerellaceae bacterium]|jgi:UDP-2,3-diacylglucosamine hydrolase|nr:UDP-2,3-diacylglucosamine diphosphatase [Tannerellaceae bacterium]